MDGVVCGAQLILGSAAVISSVGFGDVHNAQRLLVVQEGRASGREFAAHFEPGNLRRGSGGNSEGTRSGDDDDTGAGGHSGLWREI